MQLKEFFALYNIKQAKFAEHCDLAQITVSNLSLRKYRPSPLTAAKIEYVTRGKVSANEILFPEKYHTSYKDDRFDGKLPWKDPEPYTLSEEDKQNLKPFDFEE